jgi:hypothetical protein
VARSVVGGGCKDERWKEFACAVYAVDAQGGGLKGLGTHHAHKCSTQHVLYTPQVDNVGSGGVPALVRLLDEWGPEAQAHAAEVLVTLAAVDHHRKRLITRCALLLIQHIRGCSSPAHLKWP